MQERRWIGVVVAVLLGAVALAGAKVLSGGESPATTTAATEADGSAARKMKQAGMEPRAIRAAIDAKYADQIDFATPTPYPPA